MSDSGERRRSPSSRPDPAPAASTIAPPWDEAAEQAVIGAILLDPVSSITALTRVGLQAEHFYRDGHRAAVRAMLDIDEAGGGATIDPLTVANRMAATGTLQLIESGAYLARLASDVPTVENVEHYARIVREKSVLREVLAFGQETARAAVSDVLDVGSLVDGIARRAMALSVGGLTSSVQRLEDVMSRVVMKVNEANTRKDTLAGVPSGFPSLDKVTAGWQPSDLIILAARPAMGKTAFALNLLINAARDRRKQTPGVVFSLEMSAEQLASRVWASTARVPVEQLRSGGVSNQDWPQLLGVLPTISELPVFIDDTAQISVPELLRKCRQLKAEHDIGLVMVDYLQLMKAAGAGRNTSREQEISEISRGLKALAKELNVPVIALSQLNRGVESRKDKRPMLSDLRESGAIEQDADIVMFLHREDYYRDDDGKPRGQDGPAGPPAERPPTSETEVIIAKHRSGATTTVNLLFHGRYTLFMDHMKSDFRDDRDAPPAATRVDLADLPGQPTPGRYKPPPGPDEDDF